MQKNKKPKKPLGVFKGFGKPKLEFLNSQSTALQNTTKADETQQDSVNQKDLKNDLEHLYNMQSDISLNNENVVDTFVKYFYYLLSQKFNIQFETIHGYTMWWTFEYFLRFNPELIDRVSFHPSYCFAFNRRYSLIKSQIENDISQNTKKFKFFGDQEMLVKDFVSVLNTKIDEHIDIFKDIFFNSTIQDLVKDRYHTLYLNSVWFIDLTACAELGDGKNKNTGPNILNILDSASKKIVQHKMYPSNDETKKNNPGVVVKDGLVNTQAIIDVILEAKKKENAENSALILHSDSDNKQRTPEYYLVLFQNGIIPSVNKTIYGPVSNPHANQAIEIFNKYIKQKHLVNVINDSNYKGKNMMNVSFSVKEKLYDQAIDSYHNTDHQRLSSITFNPNGLTITPNQAYDSHALFRHLFFNYIALKNNSSMLPSNKHKIENLDLLNIQDQETFVNYVVNYIFVFHIQKNNIEAIYNLLEVKKGCKETHKAFQSVESLMFIFFAFAAAKSSNKRLQAYFDPPSIYSFFGVKGPGRQGHLSNSYKDILTTKEDFAKHYQICNKLINNIFFKLHELYTSFQKDNAAHLVNVSLMFKKTDAQTKELKEFMSDNVQAELKKLNITINELKTELDKFHLKDKLKEQAKARRRKSKKRDLTPAIQLGHFMKCLNLIKKDFNETKNVNQQFRYARNRLMLFLLYFSGFRIGMITQITVSDLIDIFQQEMAVSVTLSKTRQEKKQRSFSIGNNVRKMYIYGDHNLWNDYKLVLSTFDDWAKNNNKSSEETYSLSFFASPLDLSKSCSREATTKIVTNIIRKAGEQLGLAQKHILTFTSHSFRVNFITQCIHYYGIRKTQIQMGHENISNTALYSRNSMPDNQVKHLTDNLCFNKNSTKPHNDVREFSEDQRELVANILASQSSTSLNTTHKNFSFNDLESEYSIPTFSASNYCSDQFKKIEEECAFLETQHKLKLKQLKIDPTKVEKAKRHLQYKANVLKKN